MILTIETNTFAVCCTVSSFSTIALNCSIVKSVSSSGVMRHLLSAAGYTSISTLGSHNTNHPGNAMLLQGNRRLHGAAPYPHNRSQQAPVYHPPEAPPPVFPLRGEGFGGSGEVGLLNIFGVKIRGKVVEGVSWSTYSADKFFLGIRFRFFFGCHASPPFSANTKYTCFLSALFLSLHLFKGQA